MLTACQFAQDDEAASPNETDDQRQAARADLTLATRGDELLEQAVDAARADLAEQLGISTAGMVVQEAARVVWGDGAIGCPEPGMDYTQALVPGVLVRLVVDGSEYRYHGSENGEVFHCPQARAKPAAETATR